jgi:hypothetical protein
MVMWIVIAAVVAGVVLLGAAAWSVARRLPELDRAMRRLLRRQEEALKLQEDALVLQETIDGLAQRAQTATERVAIIKAGRGETTGKHAVRTPLSPW